VWTRRKEITVTEPVGHEVPALEYDETVAPRPEEEIADAARSVPDPEGHGGTPEGRTAREEP
jgi:hypothetical protein